MDERFVGVFLTTSVELEPCDVGDISLGKVVVFITELIIVFLSVIIKNSERMHECVKEDSV